MTLVTQVTNLYTYTAYSGLIIAVSDERVQPVGLISFSCYWIILHDELDQMLVKIKSNPPGIALYRKNVSKHYVLPKNKISSIYLKNNNFTPTFEPFNCLHKTFNIKI